MPCLAPAELIRFPINMGVTPARLSIGEHYIDERREAMAAWANYVTALVEGQPANVVPIRA